jgi:uncharacterized membrane protein
LAKEASSYLSSARKYGEASAVFSLIGNSILFLIYIFLKAATYPETTLLADPIVVMVFTGLPISSSLANAVTSLFSSIWVFSVFIAFLFLSVGVFLELAALYKISLAAGNEEIKRNVFTFILFLLVALVLWGSRFWGFANIHKNLRETINLSDFIACAVLWLIFLIMAIIEEVWLKLKGKTIFERNVYSFLFLSFFIFVAVSILFWALAQKIIQNPEEETEVIGFLVVQIMLFPVVMYLPVIVLADPYEEVSAQFNEQAFYKLSKFYKYGWSVVWTFPIVSFTLLLLISALKILAYHKIPEKLPFIIKFE